MVKTTTYFFCIFCLISSQYTLVSGRWDGAGWLVQTFLPMNNSLAAPSHVYHNKRSDGLHGNRTRTVQL